MLIQLFFICLLRYAAETIVDTYNSEAMYCNKLLQKAKQTQVISIRNAYCVEVVDADQTAVLNTLKEYHLSFLASNQTYATFAEVIHYSCRIPYSLEMAMQWTSGIVPLTVAFVLYKIVQSIRTKMKRPVHVKVVEEETEVAEQADAPPIFKSNTVRQGMYRQSRGKTPDHGMYMQDRPVRRIKTPEVKDKKNLSKTTEALVSNLTPKLRQRILGSDASEV